MSEEKVCCLKSGPILGCLFAQVATVFLNELISFRPPQHYGYSNTFPQASQNEMQATML